MHANSRQISSNQGHVHPKLAQTVQKHLTAEYRKPVASHNEAAYWTLQQALTAEHRPLVLDSFCGNGQSTAQLAEQYPDHLVVGIDKSALRLARHPCEPRSNCLLLRAECEDIWQLLVKDGLCIDRHYLLYPNPWPKRGQLLRRIHGHPAFPLLLQLGGTVELRSNWQTYVEEFGLAMAIAGQTGVVSQLAHNTPTVTQFESKYRNSGHSLWSFRVLIAP